VAVGEAQDLCEQLHKQEALLQQELTSLQSKLEEAASQIQSKEEALSRWVLLSMWRNTSVCCFPYAVELHLYKGPATQCASRRYTLSQRNTALVYLPSCFM
jgi:hypothetical protein